MHIGIDTRLTHYRTGGISTYMRRLVSALETLDRQNRYTILESRKTQESITKHFGRKALWTPCHHRFERLALSVELAPLRLDILHSPDFIPPLRGARRHVITVHDLTFLHYPEYLTADSRRYYNDQINSAVRQADHILADSSATKADLVQMLNVPANKITVHMLGVDERFKPIDRHDGDLIAFQKRHGLPSDYILFVGTFEPRKNISGLLEAYQALVSQMDDAPSMVLVGRRGWLFEETMKRIETLNIQDRLIWLENINDDELPYVYNLASILVTPSFYEGFGFPALEAMACGTVPIVSNRSSLPEVVGDVGLQVEPENTEAIMNAMKKALSDSKWWDEMRKAGIDRAKTFNWNHTAATVLHVYNSVHGAA